MKVTIKKEINLNGSCYFLVYADGSMVSAHSFYPNEPEGSTYNEIVNLGKAKEIATRLENGEKRMIETVYETPEIEEEKESIGNDVTKLDTI